jgi:hypothetical protein
MDFFISGTHEPVDGLISLYGLAAVDHALDSATNGWINPLDCFELVPKVRIIGANENSVAHESGMHGLLLVAVTGLSALA